MPEICRFFGIKGGYQILLEYIQAALRHAKFR